MAELACPECRAELFDGDTFCEACGKRLDGNGPDAGAAPAAGFGAANGHGTVIAPAPTGPPVRSGCAYCGARVSDGYCEGCGLSQPSARDHVELHLDLASGASDRGRRHKKNEDSMAIVGATAPDGGPLVAAVVCDGVSSSPTPENASELGADTGARVLAAEVAAGQDPARATRAALTAAAQGVAGLATSMRSAPACTYVSALVGADAGSGGDITIGWVGDSRAYWVPGTADGAAPGERPTAPVALTRDDSWAEQMVAAGALTAEEAQNSGNAHALIAWLGGDAPELDVHVSAIAPRGPGSILVCSDGLWNYFPEAEDLAAAVPDAGADPLAAARTFVRLANEAGGHDNITVVVIPVPLRPQPAAAHGGPPSGKAFSFDPPATGPSTGHVQPEPAQSAPDRPHYPGSPSNE
ncbi:serine/threonine protein phosphatase PrpC [Murinocardiopsis flavida]|uniref:Serine/threonine protein phosphatase PrpC n=1 Tax=Murinocardiopsis flavida TaxID=645275 RepID=A0A2P8DGE2_9ACTN|nr:PP2C family serine/threonine-protein phosphatase [Murinocardiopsis flavida]PSK96294.1 serine/threonine protein phosphatase PrpC [Murinocardiopsis flavida]